MSRIKCSECGKLAEINVEGKMYTGLELALIVYVVGFVIHIAYFRFFKSFYKFVENLNIINVITFNPISPTCWCFIWPLAWSVFGMYYIAKFVQFCYCIIHYIVSNQWNFK